MTKISKKSYKVIFMIIATVLVLVGLFSNYSYVIYSPGPTLDTLGKIDQDTYLITIDGKPRKETKAELHMTTVSQQGGPDRYVSGLNLITAWLDDEKEIEKAEKVYPQNVTREQIDTFNKTQMSMSQQNAVVAALYELGKNPISELKIKEADKSSSFYKLVEKGDEILSISTNSLTASGSNAKEFYDLLANTEPKTPITMEIKRKGEVIKLEGKTIPPAENSTNGMKGSRLGIFLESNYKFDDKIQFALKEIGGPSAGLIFSLSIIELLSDENILGDEKIAGTGTMSPNGKVGPIGGIRFKLIGAKKQNIKWFIMPKSNCTEAMEKPVEGIRSIPVETLKEALEVVEKIKNKQTQNLPVCR